ncbi:MAG: FAD:protein FMN transferase [Verrucomicrobiota bacterium]|nr:FAD:protein FMN transferase [Verrucomicrobiota bacterium]
MSRSVELQRARPFLGTFVEIHARAESEAQVRAGLTSAFAAIAQVQWLMSFHEATSDLSRLNRDAFARPVQVHPWTWAVLARAEEFSVKSAGVFDVTIAPLLSGWGFLPKGYAADAEANFRDVILGPDDTIRFARPLSIDLGGIAKGFAVDRAVQALEAAGVPCGMVNAGGDVRAFGDEPQQVYLRDPGRPGAPAGVVQLLNRALATSGVYFSRKLHRGALVSPLLHGAIREPLVRNISAAVSAPDCLTADALTKIVLAHGQESVALLRGYEADAVILERGQTPRVLTDHAPEFR